MVDLNHKIDIELSIPSYATLCNFIFQYRRIHLDFRANLSSYLKAIIQNIK